MATLILTRHGQSLWNAENRFTGWVDVPLSERGRAEATIAACKLRGYQVRVCYTSLLFRAIETAVCILTEVDEICGGRTPIIKHAADDPNWKGWDKYDGDCANELPIYPTPVLDERYYGDLQGKNKAEMIAQYGIEQVQIWRRSFDVAPPGGESLADTMKRTVPFFRSRIVKHLIQGDNVLVAAHGNSLRSIIMDLEKLSGNEITKMELGTAVPIVYEISDTGEVLNKQVLEQ